MPRPTMRRRKAAWGMKVMVYNEKETVYEGTMLDTTRRTIMVPTCSRAFLADQFFICSTASPTITFLHLRMRSKHLSINGIAINKALPT